MPQRKHLSIVYDHLGNPWGPFETSAEIATFVKRKWPDQEQDQDNHGEGGTGWNVFVLHPPDL